MTIDSDSKTAIQLPPAPPTGNTIAAGGSWNNCRLITAGIDTLDLGLRVFWPSDLFHTQLAGLREQAAGTDGIQPADCQYLVLPSGKPPMYRYHLKFPEGEIYLTATHELKNHPNVYVSISARTLWTLGAAGAVEVFRHHVEALGGVIESILPSRVDLAADLIIPGGLSFDFLHDHLVTCARTLRPFFKDDKLQTLYIGEGDLQVRIYNKWAETLHSGSRSTVQRAMREKTPKGPSKPDKPAMAEPIGQEPDHLLKPKNVKQVWHMDLTHIRILWFEFTLAAILDGFSRNLLALKVYARTPRTRDMARLVRRTVEEFGTPRFLITDHGTQFGQRFRERLVALGVTQVQGRVGTPFLNGKMERAFRTFRVWWGLVLVAVARRNIQGRVDSYRDWYNEHRPHSALGNLTPQETWTGKALPPSIPFRTSDTTAHTFDVRRLRCRGDPRLPVIRITRRAA